MCNKGHWHALLFYRLLGVAIGSLVLILCHAMFRVISSHNYRDRNKGVPIYLSNANVNVILSFPLLYFGAKCAWKFRYASESERKFYGGLDVCILEK